MLGRLRLTYFYICFHCVLLYGTKRKYLETANRAQHTHNSINFENSILPTSTAENFKMTPMKMQSQILLFNTNDEF